MSGMVKLHGYFRSSASFRVRIGLNLKGIEYEGAFYHLRKGEHRTAEFLTLNPQGLLPALEIDGLVLTQSMAILEYLEETRPQPSLLPSHPAERARVRALAQLISSDIHPIDNLRVLHYLRQDLGQPEDQVRAWYNHWIAKGFSALEQLLDQGPPGRFSHGDTPGLADVLLLPQVVNSQNFALDMTPYPKISAIAQACLELSAFESAMPRNQPDAE